MSAHCRFDLKLTLKKSQVCINTSSAFSGLQGRLWSEAACVQTHCVIFGL